MQLTCDTNKQFELGEAPNDAVQRFSVGWTVALGERRGIRQFLQLRHELCETLLQLCICQQVLEGRLPVGYELGIQAQLVQRLADEVFALLEPDAWTLSADDRRDDLSEIQILGGGRRKL